MQSNADGTEPAAGSQISDSSKGKRLAILTAGSRGDIQPLIALGAHLQASGFVLLILTNVNHTEFVESFNLPVVGMRLDTEVLLQKPELRGLMEKGKFGKLMEALHEDEVAWLRENGRKHFQVVKEFQPDLILSTPLEVMMSKLYANLLKVPCIGLTLQNQWPNSEYPTIVGERHLHKFVWSLLCKGLYKRVKQNVPLIEHIFAEELAERGLDVMTTFATYENFMLDYMHPFEPQLMGFSQHALPRPKGWPADLRVNLTGFWVVDKQEQERRFEGQDSKFGGGARELLQGFLKRGEPPVYLGWGSMTAGPPASMACLAVRSLRRAGLRGIILGGWANLNPSLISDEPDAESLRAFIADNIIFVDSAPHEWLFPRCRVTVHHGGAGTTAAALRAGVPTVVTPVFADQFCNAKIVQRSGCGVELPQLAKVSWQQLGDALARCATDERMRQRAASMAELLRKEDGLGNATRAIDRFLCEELATGAWEHARAARRAKHERLAGRRGCCARGR